MLLLLVACVHTVDITLAAAEVAPTMANGAQWDGPDGVLGVLGAPGPEARASLDALFGSLTGNVEVGKAVAGAAAELQKPDPAGQLSFLSSAGEAPISAPVAEVHDSFSPKWAPGTATVKAVMLRPSSSLRVALVDKDIQSDDPLGTVVLNGAQLGRALARDGLLTIETADQTSGQLLSVSVLVVNVKR
jgi:hypothetical protein